MMIAQTGIDSVSSAAVPPAESASSAIWWLIPLAIACLALTWYLRRLNNASSKTSGRKDSQKKPSSKAKSVASVSSVEHEPPRDNDSNRQIKVSKSSSKKKKKGQSKNQQNSKKLNGKQDDPKVVINSIAEVTISSEKVSAKSTESAIESASTSLSPATTPTTIPVAAIFEPLRNVVPPKRKISSLEASTEDKKPQSIYEESVNRPASGGKFERMVPSTAYNRATASRWPASTTPPVERPAQARPAESKHESKPVASVSALPTAQVAHPAIPAAKGLKSFVSKVKSATSPDSVSESVVSEERNAAESVQ